MNDQKETPASVPATALSVVAGSQSVALVIRRDEGPPRIGFWHRTEMAPIPGGGMRMTVVPDPKGPAWTTICTFDYFDAAKWPERFLAAFANNSGQK